MLLISVVVVRTPAEGAMGRAHSGDRYPAAHAPKAKGRDHRGDCAVRLPMPSERVLSFCWRSLSVRIETPTRGRGGCGRMAVLPTATAARGPARTWGRGPARPKSLAGKPAHVRAFSTNANQHRLEPRGFQQQSRQQRGVGALCTPTANQEAKGEWVQCAPQPYIMKPNGCTAYPSRIS